MVDKRETRCGAGAGVESSEKRFGDFFERIYQFICELQITML